MKWTRQTRAIALALALTAVLLLVVLVVSIAKAADMDDCHAYANRGSAAALKAMLGMPFVDVETGKYLYRKAYTFCLNSDEVPPLNFTAEEQPIVDGLPAPTPAPVPRPGSVPAGPDPAAADPAPEIKGEPLCIKHNLKTIYHGKHWRCSR